MLKCPRCNQQDLNPVKELNAISRADDETLICSQCGEEESTVVGFVKSNLLKTEVLCTECVTEDEYNYGLMLCTSLPIYKVTNARPWICTRCKEEL
jgi:hypothetical protein